MIYYVILCWHTENQSGLIHAAAQTKHEALVFAQGEYRKAKKLKTSIHINTKVLFESEDSDQVSTFYNRLLDEADKSGH